ncbi:MAG: divergent polysaccharide deacetylase family protein [Halioglobus sp.]
MSPAHAAMPCGEECSSANHSQAIVSDAQTPTPINGTLIIIIDDIGYRLNQGRAVVDLPARLNIAVLPYTPHGRDLAERAHQSGKEVLLHAPMSNLGNKPMGEGALTSEQNEATFKATLDDILQQIPHVRGVNNHMGSDLTGRKQQMGWVMEELLARELYFVDSRTSNKTIAAATAGEYGVPHLSRHVFLDHDPDTASIDLRFKEALALVRRFGQAVVIGHPHPETIAYLRETLPQLEAMGIRLAHVSEMLPAEESGYSLTSMPLDAM